MTSGRMRRVDEAIRQVIGDAVAGELKDPRVGFVTVTDVRTSADLRHARVYVSVLGSGGAVSAPDEREATLAGLRSAHGFLQGRLAGELRLKRTPTLEFIYDETTDPARSVEGGRRGASPRARLPRAASSPSVFARTSASSWPPTRTPTATRSARWWRCRDCSARSARTPRCSSHPTTCRCPRSTAPSRWRA